MSIEKPLPRLATVAYGSLDVSEEESPEGDRVGTPSFFSTGKSSLHDVVDQSFRHVGQLSENKILSEIQRIIGNHPHLAQHSNMLNHAAKLVAMIEEETLKSQSRAYTPTPGAATINIGIQTEIQPHQSPAKENGQEEHSSMNGGENGAANRNGNSDGDCRGYGQSGVAIRVGHERTESDHCSDSTQPLTHPKLGTSASTLDVTNFVLQRVVDCGAYSESEVSALNDEVNHRWRQPVVLYFLCFVNAMAAVVQGMDETVVNGAQIFYFDSLNLTNTWLQGLVNASPYLACALISVWLTAPLNDYLGRRGTIFTMCILAAGTSIWEGLCNSWQNLFLARFFLGVSIGAKSTTVPMYSSECAPTAIRGALTSFWQMFTALGIFLGYLVDVALVGLPPDVNWRWMLASTAVAPILVCLLVYLPPESPRWLMKQQRYKEAFDALLRLRTHPLIAARDFLLLHSALQENLNNPPARLSALVSTPRNQRAAQACFLLMLMQQFCGVNVIMYYSAQIFVSAAGVDQSTAIYSSLGAGFINFVFAFPSLFLIDRAGRRPLVLVTFPLLSICLFFTAAAFSADSSTVRLAMVCIGIYLYMAVYSVGEGPVPFTYAAEAFPLEIREIGMSCAVAVTWFFSFLLSLLWPSMLDAFQPAGAFAFYGAWSAVGFVVIYFVVPETKGVSLEELDKVFNETLTQFATRKWNDLIKPIKLVLCQACAPKKAIRNESPTAQAS